MAGFTSFASTAMQALSLANTVVGGVNSYRSYDQDYRQRQQQNSLDLANLQNKNTLEKEQNRLALEKEEAERRIALRRAIAKQRAVYGSRGIESDTGSAQAFLLGLENLNEEQRAQRESANAIKSSILDDNYNTMLRKNTLELTQLKQRNKLSKPVTVLQSLTSIF